MPRIILVLGCHRSGTSLITKSLECLGVSLGHRLQPPAPDNEVGFFEDLDFQTVNQSLLQGAGADWDTLGPIDVKNAAASQIVRALIEDRLHRYPVFGLKDPRFCRTLPFWRKVLPEFAEVSCVVALRHPTEVMLSLHKRNGFDEVKGYAIWLINMLEAMTGMDPFWKRIVVDYDAMWRTPDIEINRIGSTLNLPPDAEKITEFQNNFVSFDARHHHYQGGVEAHEMVNRLYGYLLAMARDTDGQADLNYRGKIMAMETEMRTHLPWLRHIDSQKAKPAVSGHRFGDFRWPA